LAEACDMLLAPEHGGLAGAFARHGRWGEGVREAVCAWGRYIQCADPAVCPSSDQWLSRRVTQFLSCCIGSSLPRAICVGMN